jgi:tetratricopeptide (TPR) repeat protein
MAALVVGLSIAAAGCGKYSFSNIRSLKAFKDGTEKYKSGQFFEAASDFERAAQFNPDFGFTYFYLGNSYDKLYKPGRKGEAENDAYLPKAVDNYRKAIDALKDSPEPQAAQIRNLAFQYLVAAYGQDRLDDFSKAEAVAKELIESDPNEPGNYQALARLYKDQGRIEEAEAMFLKATEVKPNDPVGYQLLAAFYNDQGDFDKTVAAFQKRADMEPNNAEAWHTMGTYYYEKALRDKRLTPAQGKEYVLKGLEVENKALAINQEYYEAVTYKTLLLRLQATFERDRATQQRLLAEAQVLSDKATELQKKQEGAVKKEE